MQSRAWCAAPSRVFEGMLSNSVLHLLQSRPVKVMYTTDFLFDTLHIIRAESN